MTVTLDHLVWAGPDLGRAVSGLAARTGVEPRPGGRHPGQGTANALLALGGETYLEVMAPDPDAGDGDGPLGRALTGLAGPRLVAWLARTTDAEVSAAAVREAGWRATVAPLSRETPEGDLLEWRLVRLAGHDAGPLAPILIDWGDAPHPSASAPAGVELVAFHLEAPDPTPVRALLDVLGADIEVRSGPAPRLAARMQASGSALVLDGEPLDLLDP